MKLIKLTMITTKMQVSGLLTEEQKQKSIDASALTESDMIAKEFYLQADSIKAITFLDQHMPMAKTALITDCIGCVFVAEEMSEVARLMRIYGE